MESDTKRRVIRIAVWVAVLGLLLGVLSSLATAVGASAHAVLKSVLPEDGKRLPTAPTEVVLTFSEPVSASFATVSVAGPDATAVANGKPVIDGVTVTQPLDTDLRSGGYVVAFRVVSQDGHPVSGRTTFSIAASTPSTPAGAASGAVTPSSTSSKPATAGASTPPAASSGRSAAADESAPAGGLSTRLATAVAVGALALAGGTALVALARRGDRGERP